MAITEHGLLVTLSMLQHLFSDVEFAIYKILNALNGGLSKVLLYYKKINRLSRNSKIKTKDIGVLLSIRENIERCRLSSASPSPTIHET